MRISDWSSDVCSSDLHATPPPAATAPTTMTPAPAATAGMGTPAAMVAFTSVELGSTVDASNKIVASGTSFAPKDTIYASVDPNGSGNATLSVKWTYQDGQTVHEYSKTLNATGPETTAFMISKPDGRSAERRIGTECVDTFSNHWSPQHYK